jgi:hypothetical protein
VRFFSSRKNTIENNVRENNVLANDGSEFTGHAGGWLWRRKLGSQTYSDTRVHTFIHTGIRVRVE